MPNSPKTPITSFRLGEVTKEQIRDAADRWGTTMTDAIRQMAAFSEALEKAFPGEVAIETAVAKHKHRANSEAAVKALAVWIIDHEWPNATARERGRYRDEASRRAAAILAGEGWAIRKTWPEAATEIETRSDWSP